MTKGLIILQRVQEFKAERDFDMYLGTGSRWADGIHVPMSGGNTVRLLPVIRELEVRYRFWVLLGEPVYGLALRWTSGDPVVARDWREDLPYITVDGAGQGYERQRRNAFANIDRYPDLLRELREIRPLDIEFVARIDNERRQGGLSMVRSVPVRMAIDIPPRIGVWGENIVPTSPNWDSWAIRFWTDGTRSTVDASEELKSMFRQHLAGELLGITALYLTKVRWPEGTLANLYREYDRREADRIAAETAPAADFWGSASPGRITATPLGTATAPASGAGGQSQSPEAVARAAEIEAMRRKARALEAGGPAAEFTIGANGETVVTASPVLTGAYAIVVDGGNERRVPLSPGNRVSLGLLPPRSEVRIENRGFVLETRKADPFSAGAVMIEPSRAFIEYSARNRAPTRYETGFAAPVFVTRAFTLDELFGIVPELGVTLKNGNIFYRKLDEVVPLILEAVSRHAGVRYRLLSEAEMLYLVSRGKNVQIKGYFNPYDNTPWSFRHHVLTPNLSDGSSYLGVKLSFGDVFGPLRTITDHYYYDPHFPKLYAALDWLEDSSKSSGRQASYQQWTELTNKRVDNSTNIDTLSEMVFRFVRER